ncbi:cyclin-I isoform X2 [Oryctolagus cuniculus]|uniref:cyclin-I isoform X2 n=1 Tax=Oryctolagus cuniculus TaxID=9986 RepID=UPI0022313DFA|nr:cyclin-I isoform X2 [Oryctolagus cuniculus]
MKFPGPLENQRLSFLLEKAISREAQMWKVTVPKFPTDQNVSPSQRDEVIQWLAKLKYQFNLYPETFALASSLLDRFLATVKAHPKYLSCIAISCFFLAAKTVEEDERIPVLKVLARDSFCGCSSSEILRMERIILDKLNWDLHTATPLDFLHIFHAIAVSTRPQLLFSLPKLSPSQHLAVLTKQLLHCMACSHLLQFKGSMLALAIISLEMEKLIPDWLPLTLELLQKAQVSQENLRSRPLSALEKGHRPRDNASSMAVISGEPGEALSLVGQAQLFLGNRTEANLPYNLLGPLCSSPSPVKMRMLILLTRGPKWEHVQRLHISVCSKRC